MKRRLMASVRWGPFVVERLTLERLPGPVRYNGSATIEGSCIFN